MKQAKESSDVDYPAYGSTMPPKSAVNLGDRKLAHSAQMFHYQHQKQQMLELERFAARSLMPGFHHSVAVSPLPLRKFYKNYVSAVRIKLPT